LVFAITGAVSEDNGMPKKSPSCDRAIPQELRKRKLNTESVLRRFIVAR